MGPALAHAQEGGDDGVSVLIMDLKSSDGIPKNEVKTVNELVTTAFSRYEGLDVISSGDMQQALELEGQKAAAGCDEESAACLAELAGALGAQYVVFGSLGRLGKLYILNLNLYDSEKAKSVVREKLQADTLEDLPRRIDATVDKMAVVFAEKTGAVGVTVEEEPPSALFWTGAIVGGLGLTTGVTFGVLALVGNSIYGSASGTNKDFWLPFGQTSTYVAAGGGALAVVGGGLLAVGMME
jgi:TolB-like protein